MSRVAVPRLAVPVLLALAACAPAGAPAGAQDVVESEAHRFRVVEVAAGLDRPWGMTFLPDGDLLVTERSGALRLVRDGRLLPDPVAGTPAVSTGGQGGLLDVARHPRFAENGLVYFTYAKGGPRGRTTALARARYAEGRLTGLEELFVADAWSGNREHYGSRIVFDSAGMVYIGVGERNEKTPAQELGNHKGTIVRLHDDGRVPDDGPFAGRADAAPAVYSYGHRNPQGMFWHPARNELWASEHGARGGDEINRVLPGRNYGWPAITHGVDYSGAPISPDTARPGMEQPLLHWTPSIAPSGLLLYTGDRFPNWRGQVFSGALAGEQLRRVVFDGTRPVRQEALLEGRARIRAVQQGPDGLIYLLTDERNGKVLRLEPAA